MADKSQNIFINYKFPMAEAEKASQVLNRVNQVNNLVQTGAQKTGQTISTAYSGAGKSIEAMSIQLARLKTQIQVSSDPKRVADLGRQYTVLAKQIDEANKKAGLTSKALSDTGKSAGSLTSQFAGLYQAAKLFVTAGIVREAVDIALSMATLKGNVEGVERAFDRAFTNEVNLLNRLRESTKGAVTDFELMQRTLQATNLGVAVEQLPVLFEFAAARAQQTGESVDYLVDSIVRGIGRKSLLVLDNLGLSATRLKEQFNGASLASQSVADVTKGVAEIARQELEKMGGFIDTDKNKVDQLKVSFEQLRITLAKKFESGGLIDFLKAGIQGLEMLVKGNKELFIEQARLLASQDAARIIESKAFTELGDNQQKKLDFIQQEINTRVELIGRSNDNINALKEERKEIQNTNPYDERIDALTRTIRAEDANKFVLASTILVLKEYFAEMSKVNAVEVEQTGIIERKKKEIEALQEALLKTNQLSDLGVGGKLTKALEIAQAELGDLQRAFSDIDPKPFTFKVDEAVNALNRLQKAAEKISQGQLEGRMQEAMKNLAEMKLTPPPAAAALPTTFWDEVGAEFVDNWQEITSQGVDIQADQLKSLAEQELNSLKGRLKALKGYYDEQQILAGDNERAKAQLRLKEERETTALNRKIFEKEKSTRRSQAVIDGAAGVVKAFATYPWPAAIIISALIAAQTLSQIAIINRQKPGFKKGVIDLQGPGNGTSDSIPANLSRGESVMTAWETRHAGDVLKEIRAKKLDNKVLKSLKQGREAVQSQQFDDGKIIKAIEKNRPPDVIYESGIVYVATKKGDDYRNKVRAKSVRI